MSVPNPFDVPHWCNVSTWESITNTPEYRITYELVQKINGYHAWFADRPRFAFLYDQLSRSSASILLNFCEAFGKGRGFYQSALLISRGEAYETAASISICPDEVREKLRPLILQLLPLLSKRVADAPSKS